MINIVKRPTGFSSKFKCDLIVALEELKKIKESIVIPFELDDPPKASITFMLRYESGEWVCSASGNSPMNFYIYRYGKTALDAVRITAKELHFCSEEFEKIEASK